MIICVSREEIDDHHGDISSCACGWTGVGQAHCARCYQNALVRERSRDRTCVVVHYSYPALARIYATHPRPSLLSLCCVRLHVVLSRMQQNCSHHFRQPCDHVAVSSSPVMIPLFYPCVLNSGSMTRPLASGCGSRITEGPLCSRTSD